MFGVPLADLRGDAAIPQLPAGRFTVITGIGIEHLGSLSRPAGNTLHQRVSIHHRQQATMVAGVRQGRDHRQGYAVLVGHDRVLRPCFSAIDGTGTTVGSAAEGPDMGGVDHHHFQIVAENMVIEDYDDGFKGHQCAVVVHGAATGNVLRSCTVRLSVKAPAFNTPLCLLGIVPTF